MKRYKRGDQLKIFIEKVVYKGIGIGRHEGIVVFVKNAYPGETALVEITRSKRDYLEGRVIEIVSSQQDRIEPKCRHFGLCGGCTWQDVPYERQLKFKRDIVRDSFNSIGKLYENGLIINDTLPSISEFEYRNKMEFSFSQDDGEICIGLHQKGKYNCVVPLDVCWLLPSGLMDITLFVKNWLNDKGLDVYEQKTKEGLLRFCTLRYSFNSDQVMVILTTSKKFTLFQEFSKVLMSDFPEIVSVHLIVNRSLSERAYGEEAGFAGEKVIKEQVHGFQFEVSPFSFFQPNPRTAELLYKCFLDKIDLKNGITVFDLFAGTGTIGILCSKLVNRVFCIESDESAVINGRRNASINGIKNIEFIEGEVHTIMPKLRDENVEPDLIIIDPPRAGLRNKSVRAILEAAPNQIVYISCNPTTQARDLVALNAEYSIEYIQPVDMFPQTYHIENVVILKRIDY
ncbi:23S rRNA (uracil(1939)-C(5))-methyltransferase RlmD [bacterium]|nr:23S rRNA (uracil(1939)-C(5))-methyltransferase RlmD [bacterium]